MTDTHKSAAPDPAHEVLQDSAMDQALDWLITLECASDEQKIVFEQWLNADPAHARAFAKANAIWNGQPVVEAAQTLQTRRKPGVLRRISRHWKHVAAAAVLVLTVGSYTNVPLRLQADHLTVVGERQRLQLEDGSKVLLITNSAGSSSTLTHPAFTACSHGVLIFDAGGRLALASRSFFVSESRGNVYPSGTSPSLSRVSSSSMRLALPGITGRRMATTPRSWLISIRYWRLLPVR